MYLYPEVTDRGPDPFKACKAWFLSSITCRVRLTYSHSDDSVCCFSVSQLTSKDVRQTTMGRGITSVLCLLTTGHGGSFLPYTVHFVVPTPARSHSPDHPPSGNGAANDKGESLSLFNHSDGQKIAHAIPPATPAAITDHAEFFHPQTSSSGSALPRDPLTDPHAPEWGSGGNSKQPRSRALSPPPASILKHAKGYGKHAHNAGTKVGSIKSAVEISDPSSDDVFAGVPWTIEQADQSNGGLQKAVNAACKAGTLKEKTWVSAVQACLVDR